jgi:hypothetical protein
MQQRHCDSPQDCNSECYFANYVAEGIVCLILVGINFTIVISNSLRKVQIILRCHRTYVNPVLPVLIISAAFRLLMISLLVPFNHLSSARIPNMI